MLKTNLNKVIKLFNIAKCPEFWVPLYKGAPAGTEHLYIFKNICCNFIVDIGANRGQFSLIVRKLFPDACIHSFEPLDNPARIFKTVFDADDDTHFHHYAIGPERNQTTMHISQSDDSSSLLPISRLQNEIFPGTSEIDTTVVDVASLDCFLSVDEINSPALLKLDVQGFELDALRGCERLLSSFDLIYCECSFVELYLGQKMASDIIEWLYNRGFILKGVYNTSYDNQGNSIQADFMFSRIF